jgi:LemA protein
MENLSEVMSSIPFIAIGIAIAILVFIISWATACNSIIRTRNKIRENLGVLEAQIEEFNDILNFMITSTESSVGKEISLYRKLLKARTLLYSTKPLQVSSLDSDVEFINAIQQANTSAKYIVENYPIFQSASLYANSQDRLAKSKENITAAKRMLATAKAMYNDEVETFPKSVVAGVHGFTPILLPKSEEEIIKQYQAIWTNKKQM